MLSRLIPLLPGDPLNYSIAAGLAVAGNEFGSRSPASSQIRSEAGVGYEVDRSKFRINLTGDLRSDLCSIPSAIMKTIVLILLAALSNLSARADQRSHEAAQGGLILAGLLRELAVCEIKEFSVSEVTLKDALEKAFATAGADLKYLKGYRLDTEMEDRNVTPLKGVEFGVLLTQIAYQASVQVREAEGVLHFKKLEITEPSVVAIPLKREAAEKLGLTGTAGTKEALKEIGVQVSRCSFSTERRVLIIEAYNEEIEKRRWIVKLIEMGYSVSLG